MSNPIIAPVGAIYVHEGVTIPIDPETDITAGQIVVLDQLVGVAKFGIFGGNRGSFTVKGVFEIVKDPTTHIAAGTVLYWSQFSHHVVKTPAQHPRIGKAIHDAPAGSSVVHVLLGQ